MCCLDHGMDGVPGLRCIEGWYHDRNGGGIIFCLNYGYNYVFGLDI